MRQIVLNLAVTLDGFIEGPDGEIDWCIFDEQNGDENGIGSHFDKFLSTIDTIFYGRVSYEMWGEYQPPENASLAERTLWEGVHSKKKYVFSQTHSDFEKARLISNDLEENVNKIKQAPGKDIWLYGGAGLISSFVQLNLIDRYLLAVHPVVLGAGKPLFPNLQGRINLKLKEVTSSSSGVVLLDYRI